MSTGENCYNSNSWIERQSDQRNQQVNGVKRVEKIAQEIEYGRQNGQNTARGTRKRTRKGMKLKGEYLAKSNARRKYIDAPENRQKRGHQHREANHKASKKEEEVSRV